jgi:hypothetical protein
MLDRNRRRSQFIVKLRNIQEENCNQQREDDGREEEVVESLAEDGESAGSQGEEDEL